MAEIRAWAVHALTGDVAGEIRLAGHSRFASRFGGGDFSAGVSVGHLLRRDGQGMDWPAVQRVVEWCTGGRYTLALTHDDTLLGEWLIWSHEETTDDGVIAVRGFEWDGYPAFRSLNDNYIFSSSDQLTIARRLLNDAYTSYQPSMQITFQQHGSGVTREMKYYSHSAYYSDLLEEIASPDDGFDWRVTVAPEWGNGQLQRVLRHVHFGHPVLSRATDIVVDHDGPGARSGNCVSFRQGYDFSKSAQSVYGIGAGEGAKQLWEGLSDPRWTNQGYLITTRNVSFPGVDKRPALRALTRGALAEAAELRDPAQATLLTEKIPAWPRLGDVVELDIEPTYSLPQGRTGTVRVGEVAFSLDGHRTHTVDLQAI